MINTQNYITIIVSKYHVKMDKLLLGIVIKVDSDSQNWRIIVNELFVHLCGNLLIKSHAKLLYAHLLTGKVIRHTDKLIKGSNAINNEKTTVYMENPL